MIGLAVMWDVLMQGSGGNTGTAHLAHLGGAAFGMVVAMILLWTKLLPRETYDLFSMGKQVYRRRQFKEAGLAQQRRMKQHWERAARKEGGGDRDRNGKATDLQSEEFGSKPSKGRGRFAKGDADVSDLSDDVDGVPGASRRESDKRGVRSSRGTNKHSKKVGQADTLSAHPAHANRQSEVASARAEIVRLLSTELPHDAGPAYRNLLERFGDDHASVTLSFKHHEQLAIQLYGSDDKQTAAYAIERLIEAYPRERSVARFLLLLGLLCARDLNDPIRAKATLTEALKGLSEGQERELAERTLADLG